MTYLTVKSLRASLLLLALGGLIAGGQRAVAGDRIVFGSEKTKVEPGKEKSPIEQAFKMEKLSAPSPLDFGEITPPILPRLNTNPRAEKRQRNAEDEKRNWLLLDQGELQAQDDEKNFMGLRDDGAEETDNTKGGRDYTFRETTSSRAPGQPRPPGQSPTRPPGQHRKPEANQPPPREDLDDSASDKRESRSSAILFGRQDSPTASRSGADSDLKALLGGKSTDRSADKSEFSLRDMLGGGDASPSREQQARTESFKQLLGGSPSSGGLGDLGGFRSDFTRQPLDPVMPSSLGDSFLTAPSRTLGNDSFSLKPNMSQPGNALNLLGSPDANSRPAGLGGVAPTPVWRATPVELRH